MKTVYLNGFIFFFLLSITGINPLCSQVTIGSAIPPVSGALLDLKEVNDSVGLENSTRGLLLPKVKLQSKDNLYPMFGVQDSYYRTPESKATEDALHIGLIVYATDVFDMDNCPGPYFWSGEEWVYLFSNEKEEKLTFTDGEGNVYAYKQFGDKYWMTENVRSVTKKGLGLEKVVNVITGPMAHPATLQGDHNVKLPGIWVTSQADIQNQADVSYVFNNEPVTEPFKKYISKFGLMYNYQQAVEVCPEGWRLPNYTEWKELLQIVGTMIDTLITMPDTPNPDDAILYTKAVNEALKFPVKNVGGKNSANPIVWKGVTFCEEGDSNVGFNVLPTGAVVNKSQDVWHFGNAGFFWLYDGDTFTGDGFRISILSEGEGNIGRYPKSTVGYSVRCVKNVE